MGTLQDLYADAMSTEFKVDSKGWAAIFYILLIMWALIALAGSNIVLLALFVVFFLYSGGTVTISGYRKVSKPKRKTGVPGASLPEARFDQ